MNIVYVNIGHPASRVIIRTLVEIPYDSMAHKRAKEIRRDTAENLHGFGFPVQFEGFAPGELYWAIFEDPTDEKPTLYSENYYSGVLGTQPEKIPIGGSWYYTGYFEAKSGQDYEPPKNPEALSLYDLGWDHYWESFDKLLPSKLPKETVDQMLAAEHWVSSKESIFEEKSHEKQG